ncbi:MAG: hypothetical protein IJC16_00180 [Rikenellaceae bacterium]|nr:hypothetical protein [Rikenellaceae bacterium]
MINGSEYAFEDIRISALGRSLIGFIDVRYGATKAYTNIHARGNRPVKRARGKKDAKPAQITVLQSEFEAMVRASPPGTDPTDWAPFNITVCYAPIGGQTTTDIIPYCQVTDWEKGMTTEDGNMTIVLNLMTDIPLLNQ